MNPMAYSLIWLPSVLKAAGLSVTEEPGWQMRGHGDVGAIKGVIAHHTAGTERAATRQIFRSSLKGVQISRGRSHSLFWPAAVHSTSSRPARRGTRALASGRASTTATAK
jgi:hypothetical protein